MILRFVFRYRHVPYRALICVLRRVVEADCPLLEVLEAVRPHLQLTFDNILAHINTIYVLKTRQGAMGRHQRYLRLKVGVRFYVYFEIY